MNKKSIKSSREKHFASVFPKLNPAAVRELTAPANIWFAELASRYLENPRCAHQGWLLKRALRAAQIIGERRMIQLVVNQKKSLWSVINSVPWGESDR